jgi:hypothetical protein
VRVRVVVADAIMKSAEAVFCFGDFDLASMVDSTAAAVASDAACPSGIGLYSSVSADAATVPAGALLPPLT